jgi:hypothetical protein
MLERSGAGVTGYMAMVQVDDLAAARERVRAAGVRAELAASCTDCTFIDDRRAPGLVRDPASARRRAADDPPRRSVRR